MKSFTSSVAGCQIRYHDLPGPGEPLVFIHGLGCASSYEYPRVVMDPAFSPRRVILIDLPGSGYSEKPEHYAYTTTVQAHAVTELLTGIGLTQFWLYGHSMGGSIAIEVANILQASLLGLIVSEPNFYKGGGQFSSGIAAIPQEKFVTEGYQGLIDKEASSWKGSLQSTLPVAVWRGATSLVAGIEPEWFSLFTALPVRKQLLFGEWSLPDRDFEAVQAQGIACRIIDDAGHAMSWENPTGLAQALSAFCTL
ncbi:alpha/beta fold hydrolase [Enterobacter kobei]|uniref:Alpha/beta hydrolase n=2 Tax=Enterobacter kobei TaxID=208224 RepID=A0ACC8SCA6_9ENTR|nr:alpha/beta hydrolase [Enterobacter kobei]OLR21162.1 alpha/beta hydrolase [Enterobacter kobei]BCU55491.1 alpha/beta hydrolase [Enterobacter kobei]SIQ83538.1 Pimeloyl-ACP methyl ester carboxylesterase [Enterobacter kobei]